MTAPHTYLEPCPGCGEPRILLPARGRSGGWRLRASCGQADRRAELADVAEAAAPTLFDNEDRGER